MAVYMNYIKFAYHEISKKTSEVDNSNKEMFPQRLNSKKTLIFHCIREIQTTSREQIQITYFSITKKVKTSKIKVSPYNKTKIREKNADIYKVSLQPVCHHPSIKFSDRNLSIIVCFIHINTVINKSS